MPEYAKSLGLSDAGSLSIRRSLVSKIAISAKIQDIDLDKMVNDYYLKFYRQPYNNGKINIPN